MGTKTKQNTLTAFARKHCSNWEVSDNICLGVMDNAIFNEGPCLLSQGKRCQYFEQSVFPIADPPYRYSTEPARYEAILDLYLKINPDFQQRKPIKIRLCGCGEVLKPRRHVCDQCKKNQTRFTRKRT